jgi:hypothetical protein
MPATIAAVVIRIGDRRQMDRVNRLAARQSFAVLSVVDVGHHRNAVLGDEADHEADLGEYVEHRQTGIARFRAEHGGLAALKMMKGSW